MASIYQKDFEILSIIVLYENILDNSILSAYESLDSYNNEWDQGGKGNQ
jgi:hypothetical protein